MTGIKNSKSTLLGSDTHALGGSAGSDTHSAGLSGSAILNSLTGSGKINGDASFYSPTRNNKFTSHATGSVITSVTVTTPTDPSTLVLIMTTKMGGFDGAQSLELKEDGVLLTTFSSGSDRFDISTKIHVITNPTAGSNTYQVVANPGSVQFSGCSITAVFISVNDTHAGVLNGSPPSDTHALSGSNTQTTIEDDIIE